MKTLLVASHLAPMTGPVLPDAAVAFDHRQILAVGPARDLRPAHHDANTIDLGNAIILPGLVNPHTHLELTNVTRPHPAPNFVDWVLATRHQLSTVPDYLQFIRQSTQEGIHQSLRFGVTTLADITLNPTLTRPLLNQSKIRAISFGEVLGMAGRSAQFDQRLTEATDPRHNSESLQIGIEPHAPYSLDLANYRRCVQAAARHNLPLATHLAETPDEAPFLANHQGEFRRLWQALGSWDGSATQHPGGPIRAMKDVGLLDHTPTLLTHVNYCDDQELDILAHSNASVAYCPRTHAYFNHPPHRFRDMLARDINIAIGTDSRASSPDLNLLDDLRLVHRLHPDLPPLALFQLITTRAARALGMHKKVGELTPGAAPDFCIFPTTSDDPLLEILTTPMTPSQVWLNGIRA